MCFRSLVRVFSVCFSPGQGETLPDDCDDDDAGGGVLMIFRLANRNRRMRLLGMNQDLCVRFSSEKGRYSFILLSNVCCVCGYPYRSFFCRFSVVCCWLIRCFLLRNTNIYALASLDTMVRYGEARGMRKRESMGGSVLWRVAVSVVHLFPSMPSTPSRNEGCQLKLGFTW